MLLGIFENIETNEKKEAIEKLVRNSSPSQDYFLMVIFSISMATFGILLDSIIILIGSMLIAPVLYPVLGIGMGIAIFDWKLFFRSLYTLVQSTVIALLYAGFISLFFHGTNVFELSVIHAVINGESFYMPFIVAVIAGLAASFSVVKPELSESLPGIAISVSLIPPLALMAVAGAQLTWEFSGQMLLMFFANIVGIIAASAVVFLLMNFHVSRKVADKTIAKEQKEIEEEE